jgi:hypothetical protein
MEELNKGNDKVIKNDQIDKVINDEFNSIKDKLFDQVIQIYFIIKADLLCEKFNTKTLVLIIKDNGETYAYNSGFSFINFRVFETNFR